MMPTLTLAALTLLILGSAMGCATSEPQMGFEEARTMFAGRGVQPGQPLPELSLVTLAGQLASLRAIQAGRPLVLVTASLTCNVARRQQPQVDALQQHFGDAVAVVVIYTIDAHPKGDPCPYTGNEWVPKSNEADNALVRQPTDLTQRLELAREYQQRFPSGTIYMVDTMDNASWQALGQVPNLGLLVDRSGVVMLRQGWFDSESMTTAIEGLGLRGG